MHLSVLWFSAHPHLPSLSPVHTNTQARCPHATMNSVQSPKHTVWVISCLHKFVLTSLVDFLNPHIPQDLAQVLLLLWNLSSFPKGFPTETPAYPQMNFHCITSMNYFKKSETYYFWALITCQALFLSALLPSSCLSFTANLWNVCNNWFTFSSFLLDHEGLCGHEPMYQSSPHRQHLAWYKKGT